MLRKVALASAVAIVTSSCSFSAALAAPAASNVDLSSSQKSVSAGQLAGFHPAAITVGNKVLMVKSNTLLTAAEAMALEQVLQSGTQSLILNALGRAVDGSFTIDAGALQSVQSLVVPRHVTAIDLFSTSVRSVFSGSIVNAGKLLAIANNPGMGSIQITADQISNLSGAQIANGFNTGLVPTSVLDLALSTTGGISNAGTIKSIGGLSLLAGGSFTNAERGVIEAARNMSVAAADGTITNGGVIRSLSGNISFVEPAVSNISVSSTGAVEAKAGAITFSGAGPSQWIFSGGKYLSRELDFNLGSGSGVANLKAVTGVVNATAMALNLQATGAPLKLGAWNVQGDPVITDTESIFVGSMVTGGAPLILVSGKDIVAAGANGYIDTSSADGAAGEITLIAGANFVKTGNDVTILGSSKSGGSVDLLSNPIDRLDSSSVAGCGGNVLIAAFAGNQSGSGRVLLPATSHIITGGADKGESGWLYVLAGSSDFQKSVVLGNITTAGGAGGKVVIATEQPNVTAGKPLTLLSAGGGFSPGSLLGGTMSPAAVSVGTISSGGGDVSISAGKNIQVGNGSTWAIDTAPSHSQAAGGNVSLIANAGSISPSQSDITLEGGIRTGGGAESGSGGNVVITTTGNISSGAIATDASEGNGGSVYMMSGSSATHGNITIAGISTSSAMLNGGDVVLIGASQDGQVSVRGVGQTSINTGAAAGNAGAVTISTPGEIAVANIRTRGGGNGGSVFLSSGAASGVAISDCSIDTATTGTDNQMAGGIYLLTAGGGLSVSKSQNQPHGYANFAIEVNHSPMVSLDANAGTIDLSFSAAGISNSFAPGGYGSINDQGEKSSGNLKIDIRVANDPNVIVPIVSLSGSQPLTVLGSQDAPSGVFASMSGNSRYLLFGAAGVRVGGSNSSLVSVVGNSKPLAGSFSNNGDINVGGGAPGETSYTGLSIASGAVILNLSGRLQLDTIVSGSGGNAVLMESYGLIINRLPISAGTVLIMPSGPSGEIFTTASGKCEPIGDSGATAAQFEDEIVVQSLGDAE